MMDSDFINKLQSITLTEEEGEVIKVGVSQRERMLEECSLSLLGRFLTTRAFNQRGQGFAKVCVEVGLGLTHC